MRIKEKLDESGCSRVLVKGIHGDIELVISDQRMTKEEWKQFNIDMTKIIYSTR